MNGLDARVDRAFDRLRGRAATDRLFYSASRVGDHALLWHGLAVVVAMRSPTPVRTWLRLAGALGAESLLVNVGIKSVFRRERPVHDGPRPHHLRQPLTSSFPSGHATAGFMAATLLSDTDPKLAPLWFGLAATVASSRIYVRIHHASDVAVGAALGTGLGVLVRRRWPLR